MHNPAALGAATPTWIVDSLPAVVIGRAAGDAPYLFGRIAAAVRMNNGRIAIADAQAEEIRFFDSTGAHLSTAGGEGSGPGEYVNLFRMFRDRGDSLLVVDYEGGRAHIIDSLGRHGRSFRPHIKGVERHEYSAPRVLGVFSDGSLAIRDYTGTCRGVHRTGGYCEDSARFARISEEGQVLAEFGVMASDRAFTAQVTGLGMIGVGALVPQIHVAIHDTLFYRADGASTAIEVFSMNGKLVRRISLEHPSRTSPITGPRPGETARASGVSQKMIEQTHRIADAIDAGNIPPMRKVFASLIVDRMGNIWLREFPDFNAPRGSPVRWFVLNPEGKLIQTLMLPSRIMTYSELFGGGVGVGEIGKDYLLDRRIDSTGVDQVRLWRLRKG